MINPKLLHNLSWIPAFLIGLCSSILGILWLTTGEPWFFDEPAGVNQNLPLYLILICRFFGLGLIGLGLMINIYVLITFMGTTRARNSLLVVLGFILVLLFYLEYTYVSISPFIYLTYALLILYLVSLWASLRLNRQEKQVFKG